MGILENLSLMELVGGKPKETVIIGVEPAELEPGLELSAKLQERMPKIIQTVLGEIHPRVETKV
jgi:hydrogenase maturation protease